MIDRDETPTPKGTESDRGHICARCGETFLVGPILHADDHPESRGGTSALCNDCLIRRSREAKWTDRIWGLCSLLGVDQLSRRWSICLAAFAVFVILRAIIRLHPWR